MINLRIHENKSLVDVIKKMCTERSMKKVLAYRRN